MLKQLAIFVFAFLLVNCGGGPQDQPEGGSVPITSNPPLPHESPNNVTDPDIEDDIIPENFDAQTQELVSAPPRGDIGLTPPGLRTLRASSWNLHNFYHSKSGRSSSLLGPPPRTLEQTLFGVLTQYHIDIIGLQEVYVTKWTKSKNNQTKNVIQDRGFFLQSRGKYNVLQGPVINNRASRFATPPDITTPIRFVDSNGWTHRNARKEYCPILWHTDTFKSCKSLAKGWNLRNNRKVHWARCTTAVGTAVFYFGCSHLSAKANETNGNIAVLFQKLGSTRSRPGIAAQSSTSSRKDEFILGLDANSHYGVRQVPPPPQHQSGNLVNTWKFSLEDFNNTHKAKIVMRPIKGPFKTVQGISITKPFTKVHRKNNKVRVAKNASHRVLDNLIWYTQKLVYIEGSKQVIPLQQLPRTQGPNAYAAKWLEVYKVSDHLPVKADFTIN